MRFDRLERPEIDLGRAAARSASEENQEHRQRQRRDQRQVAERDESHRGDVDERQRRHQGEPEGDRFRIAHEQQVVAQRIRPAQEHGEADGGQEMRGGQQQQIGSHAPSPPEKRDGVKADDVQGAEQPRLTPELVARPDGQVRLQPGDVRRGEQGDGVGNSAGRAPWLARRRSANACRPFAFRMARVLTVAREMAPTFGSARRSPAIGAEEAEKLAGREAAVVRVRERGAERGLESSAPRTVLRFTTRPPAASDASSARSRPAQASAIASAATADGDDQQRLGPSVPGLAPHAVLSRVRAAVV